jgi:hypothetical protein
MVSAPALSWRDNGILLAPPTEEPGSIGHIFVPAGQDDVAAAADVRMRGEGRRTAYIVWALTNWT